MPSPNSFLAQSTRGLFGPRLQAASPLLAVLYTVSIALPLSAEVPSPTAVESVEVVPTEGSLAGADSPAGSVTVQEKKVLALSLDEAINRCLLNDPKLLAGFEAINQASADSLTASLLPNPSIFADIQLLPLARPFTVNTQGGPPQQDVILGYPIDWFLFAKRSAAMATARLGVRVSEEVYADLVRQRVAQAAVAYFDLLESRELYTLVEAEVKGLETAEAVTSKAFEGGGRPRVDLQRLRLNLLNARQSLRIADRQRVRSKAQLLALLGGAGEEVELDPTTSLGVDQTVVVPNIASAYASALENRADLRALRIRINQARADIRLQQRLGYPPVGVTAGYTRQYQEKAIGFPDADSWSASIQSTVPLFDRNQGHRQKALSLLTQSQHELRAAEVALYAEIETLLNDLSLSITDVKAISQEQLTLAQDVLQSINRSYNEGGRPLLEFLDAQRSYRDTYRAYTTSRANYWRAWYRLAAAMGRPVNEFTNAP